MEQSHAKAGLLATNKFSKLKFSVHHTAAHVEYNASGFRSKNKDETSTQVFDLLRSSSTILVSKLMEVAESANPSKAKTLSIKFRQQLNDLMHDLNSCDVHFIRCIKPNEQKAKDVFN